MPVMMKARIKTTGKYKRWRVVAEATSVGVGRVIAQALQEEYGCPVRLEGRVQHNDGRTTWIGQEVDAKGRGTRWQMRSQ
jgi:hypothetical protein